MRCLHEENPKTDDGLDPDRGRRCRGPPKGEPISSMALDFGFTINQGIYRGVEIKLDRDRTEGRGP
jgi:hypothetical protein